LFVGKALKNEVPNEGLLLGTSLREISILKAIRGHANVMNLIDVAQINSFFFTVYVFYLCIFLFVRLCLIIGLLVLVFDFVSSNLHRLLESTVLNPPEVCFFFYL
jgi:serine/threonine protein kinase